MSCPYDTDCETSESDAEDILPTDSEPEEEIESEDQNKNDEELDDDFDGEDEDLYACDTDSCPSRGIPHDGSAQCECGEAKLLPPAKRLRKGKHERYASNGDESE